VPSGRWRRSERVNWSDERPATRLEEKGIARCRRIEVEGKKMEVAEKWRMSPYTFLALASGHICDDNTKV
jgi:hypothetical protein